METAADITSHTQRSRRTTRLDYQSLQQIGTNTNSSKYAAVDLTFANLSRVYAPFLVVAAQGIDGSFQYSSPLLLPQADNVVVRTNVLSQVVEKALVEKEHSQICGPDKHVKCGNGTRRGQLCLGRGVNELCDGASTSCDVHVKRVGDITLEERTAI